MPDTLIIIYIDTLFSVFGLIPFDQIMEIRFQLEDIIVVIIFHLHFRDDRAFVAVLQSLAWTLGLCILPFIYWIVGDWLTFFTLTSIPMLVFLFIPT